MNIKLNLKKFLSLKGTALALALTLSTTALTGCSKKAECNITNPHAHLYTSEQGYIRYIDKEYLSYEGFTRNEESISIEGEEELYRLLDKKDLLKISDNLDLILESQEKNKDYMEYRYRYIFMQPIPHTRKIGKVTTTYFTYIPMTRHSWTSNPNHSRLTGEQRLCHYVYIGYKIEKNEKGKYVLIPSDYVDDIREIMDEYPYITTKYYKIVNLSGEEVDYEDGKEEDLTDEEKKRIEDYNNQSKQNEEPYRLVKKYNNHNSNMLTS